MLAIYIGMNITVLLQCLLLIYLCVTQLKLLKTIFI